jgi:acetyl-CoA acetyltransferase
MDVYILGMATHRPAERVSDKRLEEMVFDTTRAALDDAGVERAAIEQVTIAGCDEIDGRSISSMLLAMPAGAYLRDEIKCTDSGITGLCLGAMRMESGLFDLGLVVSWNKSSEAPVEDVMRMRCEPFFTRPIGLNMSIADGLFAQVVASAFAIRAEAVERSVQDACARALRNPRGLQRPVPPRSDIALSPFLAAPLRRGHQAPLSDGAVALVLASARWLQRRPGARCHARLAGIGWRSERYDLGGERLAGLTGFRAAFADALAMAGCTATDLDVVELDGQTGWHQLAFAKALGPLSASLSPSGGPFAQNPYFCTGLVNVVEAAHQVAGSAGPVQVAGARRAAAHGCHGFAQQGNASVILERV